MGDGDTKIPEGTNNGSDLIGEPIKEVPKKEPGEKCNSRRSERVEEGPNIFLGYCKNGSGKNTEHDDGRCWLHGGASPRGEDHPRFKHGLFSDHLSEEDREDLERIEAMDNAAGLQSIINYELLRLRRAVRHMENDSEEEDEPSNFFEAFNEIVSAAVHNGGMESEDIKELASLFDSGSMAMMRRVDQIRKLVKTYEEITAGKKVNIDGELSQEISGGGSPVSITWSESQAEQEEAADE